MNKQFNSLNASAHIETSQLICCANQLTGFYMRVTLAFDGSMELINSMLKLAQVILMLTSNKCRSNRQ